MGAHFSKMSRALVSRCLTGRSWVASGARAVGEASRLWSSRRTSDRVRIEVPGEFPQLTLAAWVRIEGVNNWLSSLMLTDDWEPREAHWQITVKGEIILGVMQGDGGGDGHHSPPVIGPELLGHWVHIVTVYDAGPNRIIHYLNGSPVSQGALSIPVPLRIGSANIGNWNNARYHDIDAIRSLNGRIDEFAIFRRIYIRWKKSSKCTSWANQARKRRDRLPGQRLPF